MAQRFGIARFSEELMRGVQGLEHVVSLGASRQNDADDIGIFLFDLLKERRSVHSRHPHVGYNNVKGCRPQLLERRVAARHEYRVEVAAVLTERVLKTLQHAWIVVDEENPF